MRIVFWAGEFVFLGWWQTCRRSSMLIWRIFFWAGDISKEGWLMGSRGCYFDNWTYLNCKRFDSLFSLLWQEKSTRSFNSPICESKFCLIFLLWDLYLPSYPMKQRVFFSFVYGCPVSAVLDMNLFLYEYGIVEILDWLWQVCYKYKDHSVLCRIK